MTDNLPAPKEGNEGQFLFYDTEDGTTRVHLLVDGSTVWMPQKGIADLFETTVANVNTHIRNILDESEVHADSVIKDYLITATDGKQYKTKHYNLDMLLAIGYRVRSPRGVQFRRWATATLREYLVKGFVLNDERLKAAETTFGKDYFEELLERIRAIRASERRFYQKITDSNRRWITDRHVPFADLSAFTALAESAKLEQAIRANLKGLGYGL